MGRVYLVRFAICSMLVQTFLVYKWLAALLKPLTAAIRNSVWTRYEDQLKQVTVA